MAMSEKSDHQVVPPNQVNDRVVDHYDPLPVPGKGSYGWMDTLAGYHDTPFTESIGHDLGGIVPIIPPSGMHSVRYMYRTTVLFKSLRLCLKEFVSKNIISKTYAQKLLNCVCLFLMHGYKNNEQSVLYQSPSNYHTTTFLQWIPSIQIYATIKSYRHRSDSWVIYLDNVTLLSLHPKALNNAQILNPHELQKLREYAKNNDHNTVVVKMQEGIRALILPNNRILKMIMIAPSSLEMTNR